MTPFYLRIPNIVRETATRGIQRQKTNQLWQHISNLSMNGARDIYARRFHSRALNMDIFE